MTLSVLTSCLPLCKVSGRYAQRREEKTETVRCKKPTLQTFADVHSLGMNIDSACLQKLIEKCAIACGDHSSSQKRAFLFCGHANR